MNGLDLLEALPIMLWTARADGVWTHVNSRWTSYTGSGDDAPGHFGFEAALHPDDVAPTITRWTEAVARGTPYRAECRLRRSDGLYRWHLTQGARVPAPDADVVWAGACTDIHDQKVAEQGARHAQEAAVRALGLMLELRDHETKGHTDRVTGLALRLGQAVGLTPATLEALRLGAYLHDVGKVTVPDAILLKPGALTAGERLSMQEHVVNGERFASSLGFLTAEALEVIRGHHERWDGSGYPHGQRAAEIPLLARIFALADVYDALISERPYKRAWTPEEASGELRRQAGQQFDPHLTAVFLGLVHDPAAAAQAAPPSPRVTPTHPSESLLALALEEAAISVLITDAQQRLVYVNAAFCRVTGYSPEEVIGRNPRFLQGPATDPADKAALREDLAAERITQQRILNYSRTGEKLWFEMHITPIFLQGKVAYYVAIQSDQSAQVTAQQELEWTASHDILTGLRNRTNLHQNLEELTGAHALIFLDLDGLKDVNDRYGHAAGDEVLRAVASTLREQVREEQRIFRLGGDEFLLLIPGTDPLAGERLIARLREALALISTGDGPLSGSFGIAYFPEEGRDLWQLIGLADGRMYQEKLGQAGRRGASDRS